MTSKSRIIRLTDAPTLERLDLIDAPIPTPGPDEVVMRVRASSLNFHDYLVVAGHIPVPRGRVPLSDGAGELVTLGSAVEGLAVGDRVMGAFVPLWISGPPTATNNAAIAGETIDGFASDYVVVPANSVVRVPSGWSYQEAATLPCAGLTAWRALVVEGELTVGHTVLLPGSGGLSVYALQIAKALGVGTIVTSSNDEKLRKLSALGADQLINYRTTDEWGIEARDITGGRGVDLVLELGGQSSFAKSVEACRMGGHVIVVGTTGNAAPELPLRDVVMRHIRVNGIAVGNVSALQSLAAFVEAHQIRPIIDRSFGLDELSSAFRYQLSGQHLGKIVVTY